MKAGLGLVPLLMAAASGDAGGTASFVTPGQLFAGQAPHALVTGLKPGEEVTVETFRSEPVAVNAGGRWSTEHPLFHAKARFRADRRGRIELDRAAPIAGTYVHPDPRGLLWSGVVVGRSPEPGPPADVPDLASLPAGKIVWVLRQDRQPVVTTTTSFTASADDLRIERIDTPALVGVYAAPAGATRAPALIFLHGSEGGDFGDAKAIAQRFARRGFATLALIYFSWPYKNIANAPAGFVNLPVERLATARDWLARQPEADVDRLAMVGVSKGSEFGLLGASVYPWIKKLVACVPSSLVWGGFGGSGNFGAGGAPSFTYGGKPVASLPYGDYGPVERHEITSAERHRRDRAAASAAVVAAATIPVERIRARMLLLSSQADAVWPSSLMSGEIVNRLRAHGMAERVRWLDFPRAGHFICGTGDSPTRYFDGDPVMNGGGDATANGEAGSQAWDATLAFLRG